MLRKSLIVAGTVALMGTYNVAPAHAQQNQHPVSSQMIDAFMKQYNSNNDGKLTLDQANKAAEARFLILDTDHDGTVDEKEIVPGGVSTQEFQAVNPDKDKTLDKTEYKNLVKQKFDAADTNHNGSLTKDKLDSPAGHKLMGLLQ